MNGFVSTSAIRLLKRFTLLDVITCLAFPKAIAKRQNIFIGYVLTSDANVAEMSNAL